MEYNFIYNNCNFNLKNTKLIAPLNVIEMLNFSIKNSICILKYLAVLWHIYKSMLRD